MPTPREWQNILDTMAIYSYAKGHVFHLAVVGNGRTACYMPVSPMLHGKVTGRRLCIRCMNKIEAQSTTNSEQQEANSDE